MKIDLSQFRRTFLQESAEHVSAMETGLLDLRSNPGDIELLNAIFRSAHSIKGGAGSFGLTNLVRFTHALENLLDQLRSMEVAVTEAVIGVLLESVDVLRTLLEGDAEGEDTPLPPAAPELVRRMEAMIAVAQPSSADSHEKQSDLPLPIVIEHPPAQSDARIYVVTLRPAREMFSSGANPIMLIRNLAALGTLRACQVLRDELPSLAELDPSQCYLSWIVELSSTESEQTIREVFEFVEHLATITIEAPAVENKLVLRSEPVAITPSPAEQPLAALQPPPESKKRRASDKKTIHAGEASSIRVPTDKVDRLIDLVGELVIAQAMTAQMVDDFTPDCLSKLRDAVSAMERNTRELHERVMSVRMMPVASLFQRYVRTVYDIAQATGKQIHLEISGEETEIDKSMLEQLADPLTHLIRNAADHGIEMPQVRQAAGKPEVGVIHLRAFHRSGRVVIEVADDGAGIDQQRVYGKAVERGIIAAGTVLTPEQINLLIFEPGFSTRDQVSDLSGRGVGMDVVKRNVLKLSGTVSLITEKGAGSTVTIELPLTLAILDGLLVRVADRTLVLPLLSVIETVAARAGQISRVAERGEVINVREESIPLLYLQRFLQLGPPPDSGPRLVIVVEAGRKKIGLVVDELMGQQQVVVKSLERNLHRVEGLMGATILGDGCVAPIIDIAGLATMDLFSLLATARPPGAHRPAQLQAS